MRGLSLIVALSRGAGPAGLRLPEGWQALREGKPELARAAALRVLERPVPARADRARARLRSALRLLADAHLAAGAPHAALPVYERLLALGVDESSLLVNAGNALRATGRAAAAELQFRAACQLDSENPQAHANHGATLCRLGRAEDALGPLARAVELRAEYPIAEAALAAALEATNRIDEARRVVDGLLARHPREPSARFVRATLDRRAGDFALARERLEQLLADAPGAELEARAWSELGRVLDRLHEHGAAYAAAREGQQRLARAPEAATIDPALYPSEVQRVRRWIEARRESGPGACEEWRGVATHPSEPAAPIFVVGFPRSGTTLVEHVLGALPGVRTSDEAPIVGRLVLELPRLLGRAFRYPDDVDSLRDDELRLLRAEYARGVAARVGDVMRRFVDKNPWNLVHAPFLRRLFPDSPIVVTLRDPRDAVLSAFFQDFRPNAGTIHLFELEAASRACAELLGLWLEARPTFEGPWTEVRYEDLVSDFEHEARRLLEAVGERWDPAVLRFHEMAAERVVSTPSRDAVGRPITPRSVGRWRAYEEPMGVTRPLLEPLLEPLGYAEAPRAPLRGDPASSRSRSLAPSEVDGGD